MPHDSQIFIQIKPLVGGLATQTRQRTGESSSVLYRYLLKALLNDLAPRAHTYVPVTRTARPAAADVRAGHGGAPRGTQGRRYVGPHSETPANQVGGEVQHCAQGADHLHTRSIHRNPWSEAGASSEQQRPYPVLIDQVRAIKGRRVGLYAGFICRTFLTCTFADRNGCDLQGRVAEVIRGSQRKSL
jgi:hypothetical protein